LMKRDSIRHQRLYVSVYVRYILMCPQSVSYMCPYMCACMCPDMYNAAMLNKTPEIICHIIIHICHHYTQHC